MPPQRMTPEQRKAHVAEQRARKLAEQIAASEARVDRIWRGRPPEPVTYAKQVADKEGNGKAPEFKPAENKLPDGVALDDFSAFMPMHSYIYHPTREMWPAASVNARIDPVPLVDDDGLPVVDDKGRQQVGAFSKRMA